MVRRLLSGLSGLSGGAAVGLAWASSTRPSKLAAAKAAPGGSAEPMELQPSVELLVHNISHSDMVVRLQEETGDAAQGEPPRSFLACRSAWPSWSRSIASAPAARRLA